MISRIMIYGIVQVLLFNVLADFYFYKFCIARLTKNREVHWAHWIIDAIFTLIMLGFFVVSVFDLGRVPSEWFGSFIFVYLLVYSPKFTFMLFSWPALLGRNRSFKRIFYALGVVTAIINFITLFYGGTFGPSTLVTKKVEITSVELPPAFDGYRIAHISDFHLGNMRNDKLLHKTLRNLEKESPDVIIFSGDLVHNRTSEAYRFEEILGKFTGVAPVYAVLGNHDYGQYARWANEEARNKNMDDLKDFYSGINWALLNNTNVFLHDRGDSITLIGVENWGEGPFQKYGDLEKAMEGTENAKYKILVTHDPSHWRAKVLGRENIDLALSGHTHGMQYSFRFFGKRYSPASLREKYWGGLYSEGDQHIYVNVGMGVTLFPFRYGAFPELTIITLKKKG